MQKLIDGELHTAESILIQYKPLIYKHASRLCGNDYHHKEDLKQVGYIGLVAAFEKFDADSEIKFVSYAYKYVQGYMRNLNRKNGLIHVPPKVKENSWKIDKQELWSLENFEIAERMGISVRMVESCRIFFNLKTVFSSDAENDAENTVHDVNGYEHDLSHPSVEYYTQSLNDREKVILLGLMNGDSYSEIGKDIGVSKARVGQLFKKIKSKVEIQILKESRSEAV